MINTEQMLSTLIDVDFKNNFNAIKDPEVQKANICLRNFWLYALWFVFDWIFRKYNVHVKLYFFFINLSNIVWVLGSRGHRKLKPRITRNYLQTLWF